jgi:putative ABC transport system permease protein
MYADSIARPRFNTILLGCFAALALLLAITGVYGVIAMTMNQRLREIGVRMALGASASDVKLLTLRWGIRPVLIGTFLGAGVSLALGRLLESQLFEVSAADPATYLTVLNVER